MNIAALASPGSGVINLDQPGTYLHWSIFTVSLANLVLIAVMVVIFGVALLLFCDERWLAGGLVIGAATLVRPESPLLLVAVGLAVDWHRRREERRTLIRQEMATREKTRANSQPPTR